jgi:hypothetical protein
MGIPEFWHGPCYIPCNADPRFALTVLHDRRLDPGQRIHYQQEGIRMFRVKSMLMLMVWPVLVAAVCMVWAFYFTNPMASM